MKMALKDGKVLIKDADSTQGAVIRSWNRMRWNKSLKLFEGDLSGDLLDRLAKLVQLPQAIEEERQAMHRVRRAVDQERARKDPEPLVRYPVTKQLYKHQVRAANMALITFGIIPPEAGEVRKSGK